MATVRTVVVFAAVHLATGEQAAVDGPVIGIIAAKCALRCGGWSQH